MKRNLISSLFAALFLFFSANHNPLFAEQASNTDSLKLDIVCNRYLTYSSSDSTTVVEENDTIWESSQDTLPMVYLLINDTSKQLQQTAMNPNKRWLKIDNIDADSLEKLGGFTIIINSDTIHSDTIQLPYKQNVDIKYTREKLTFSGIVKYWWVLLIILAVIAVVVLSIFIIKRERREKKETIDDSPKDTEPNEMIQQLEATIEKLKSDLEKKENEIEQKKDEYKSSLKEKEQEAAEKLRKEKEKLKQHEKDELEKKDQRISKIEEELKKQKQETKTIKDKVTEEKQKEIDEIQEELTQKKKDLRSTTEKLKTTEHELTETKNNLSDAKNEISTLQQAQKYYAEKIVFAPYAQDYAATILELIDISHGIDEQVCLLAKKNMEDTYHLYKAISRFKIRLSEIDMEKFEVEVTMAAKKQMTFAGNGIANLSNIKEEQEQKQQVKKYFTLNYLIKYISALQIYNESIIGLQHLIDEIKDKDIDYFVQCRLSLSKLYDKLGIKVICPKLFDSTGRDLDMKIEQVDAGFESDDILEIMNCIVYPSDDQKPADKIIVKAQK